ncbi:MAG: type II toxin-antitoxin system MqsA family antitoxin [Actinobacteria bacterium]|nr:type II toxin-antitoxin system MqsA family antitoxin [Actinomycetota bacterium]MBU1942574.1 type II toxin-antitoxin system MqsA family antitoxin [Actinomycetota bacterium]MBU2688750.1 type II toxin-antitoxin system MqsA family antitoxin [Actinomycetota bacterium]
MNDKCPACGGTIREDKVRHPPEHEGRIVIIENMPVLVCNQCGEILLRPETMKKIQKLVWSGSEPERTESIPVYDLAV